MSMPMVITAAMVGAETTREQTPYLPITAEETAEYTVKCREAGAAMVHLHVRKADCSPSQDAELFRAASRAIRNMIKSLPRGSIAQEGERFHIAPVSGFIRREAREEQIGRHPGRMATLLEGP